MTFFGSVFLIFWGYFGRIWAYGGHHMVDLSSPHPMDPFSARLVPFYPSKMAKENPEIGHVLLPPVYGYSYEYGWLGG